MTSGQSATETTRFDTIEDVSHAIGNFSYLNNTLLHYKGNSTIMFEIQPRIAVIYHFYFLDACKKAILETTENTDSRKEMVLRLIQLRIRFEDMKERANVTSNINSSYETRGHVFIR